MTLCGIRLPEIRALPGGVVNKSVANEGRVARNETFFSRLFIEQQHRLSDAFTDYVKKGNAEDTILDVGRFAPGGMECGLSGYVDEPLRSRIRSYRIPSHTSDPVPENCLLKDNAVRLPFGNAEFDWVFCNGVIEHFGSTRQQYGLVEEIMRIAGKGVFLATQNRRHLIDFQASMPFVHWLPDQWRRRVIGWSGKTLGPCPHYLNSGSLYQFAQMLPEKPEHDVGHKRVFGIKAHFFLMITKRK